jgi:hypothetical protein
MSLASPEIRTKSPTGTGRFTGPALSMILVLVLLLAPAVYLFGRAWSASGVSADVVAAERAAITVGRPLNNLLAALVDARSTAAHKITVDDSGIHAAVNEINRLDSTLLEQLGADQRWSQLTSEIDTTLSRNASGADALAAYATSIALNQAMLDWIADSSRVTQDPAGSYLVIEVALHRLPEAVNAAGELATIAATGDGKAASQAMIAVSQDRLNHVAEEVGVALRSTTEHSASYAADLRVLQPLDEFLAAANEVSKAAAELGTTSAALDRIDNASTKLKTAAVALAAAVFNAFTAQLDANAGVYSGQRQILVVLGLLMVLATAALLWLRFPRTAAPKPHDPLIDKAGRHGYQEGIDAKPERTEHPPNLVDARELLSRESAGAGRVRKR